MDWILTSERLPKPKNEKDYCTRVLVPIDGYAREAIFYFGINRFEKVYADGSCDVIEPKYWMSMPEVPEDVNQKSY